MATPEEARQELMRREAVAELKRREDQARLSPREEVLLQRQAGTSQLFGETAGQVLSDFDRGVMAGINTIRRGISLGGEQTSGEATREQQLLKESTAAKIGEFAGESAPFAALAPLGGAAAGAGRLARVGQVALQGALGAGEAGILARGRGEDIGDIGQQASIGGAIGAGVEALTGPIGRLAIRVAKKIRPGKIVKAVSDANQPSNALLDALDETNTSFGDLTPDDIQELNQAVQKELSLPQKIREQRFTDLGIRSTLGDVTQDTAQQATEQRLLATIGDQGSEPLRQVKLAQSQEFEKAADKIVKNLGVPDRAGKAIKDALTGSKELLRDQKNALYKRVAKSSPEILNAPIFTDEISKALPGIDELESFRDINPTNAKAIENMLVRFGVEKDPAKVKRLVDAGRSITPLTLGSFEDFRQALNAIERSDISGQTSRFTGPIRNSLDKEATLIDDAVREARSDGVSIASGVVDTLKEARSRVRELKQEFSPQAVSGRLIGLKRDNITPVVETSKVVDELFRKSTPKEQVKKTVTRLSKSPAGRQAIADLQASSVMQALEKSLAAESRKVSGTKVISGIQFKKELDKIGQDKLRIIFKDNKEGFKQLKKLTQAGLDLSPSNIAVPKGSAAVNLDIATRLIGMPGVSRAIEIGRTIRNTGAASAATREALQAAPESVAVARQINTRFPRLATALGLTQIGTNEEAQ